MRELLANISERRARQLAAGMGLSVLAFGVLPAIAPGPFARIFGFEPPSVETASMIRSLGVRDVVMGAGLVAAATRGGDYAPWLLARTFVDGGDTASVSVAIAQGKRGPRFIALGGLALAATFADAVLWALARRAMP